MRIDLCSCEQCVSDADVLIKFIRGGQLGLLCSVMPTITIPEYVRREVLGKIGLGPAGIFAAAIRDGRVRVIDTDCGAELSPEQLRSIAVFVESFSPFMDDGELRAAAVANELEIPIMLSDDRNAQSVIQVRTTLEVLRVHEVLALAITKGIASHEEAASAFDAINRLQKHPVTVPAKELFVRAHARFARSGSSAPMNP